MEILESVSIAADKNTEDFRFPVQYVNRPNLDFRGFCGTIASGRVSVGDNIRVLPSGKASRVKSIVTFDGTLASAFVDQAVTLTTEDEVDISRGDMIVHADAAIEAGNHLQAHVVWMSEDSLSVNQPFFFKFASRLTTGKVEELVHKIDVNTLENRSVDALQLNDIALVNLTLNQQVVVDPYVQNRATGAFIIIDRLTNVTVGAGMVTRTLEAVKVKENTSAFAADLQSLVARHYPGKSAAEITALVEKFIQYL